MERSKLHLCITVLEDMVREFVRSAAQSKGGQRDTGRNEHVLVSGLRLLRYSGLLRSLKMYHYYSSQSQTT